MKKILLYYPLIIIRDFLLWAGYKLFDIEAPVSRRYSRTYAVIVYYLFTEKYRSKFTYSQYFSAIFIRGYFNLNSFRRKHGLMDKEEIKAEKHWKKSLRKVTQQFKELVIDDRYKKF